MQTYITIKDEDGIVRPLAILEKDNEEGLWAAKKKASKDDKIVRVQITEIEEID